MYVYRKDYICQHSSKNKSHNSDLTRLRDKNCSASIKIVVKKKYCEHTKKRSIYASRFRHRNKGKTIFLNK